MFRSKGRRNEKDLAMTFFNGLPLYYPDCTEWTDIWTSPNGRNGFYFNDTANGLGEGFYNNDTIVPAETMSRWFNGGKLVLIHLPEWKENHYEIRWHDMDYGDL